MPTSGPNPTSGSATVPEETVREARELARAVSTYQYEYYVLNKPSVDDREFDRLFDRLRELEDLYPQLKTDDSPTQRIGSDLGADFPEVRHSIPVLSLDKVYSLAELQSWVAKLGGSAPCRFVAEEKLDGASLVLYYREGVLERAVTRGNGEVGNDITVNVKTIKSIPLRLPEPRTGPVRGEVFLSKFDFERINSVLEVPYANPRNLAAGTLRRVKSSEVARTPLRIFVYESFFEHASSSHWENLGELKRLGFPVNPRTRLLDEEDPEQQLRSFVSEETDIRADLEYEIDGLVFKVDDLELRERLGYTSHHPRWAMAYKFESPQGVSRVQAIDIQIGRTGRVTPVARIEPVEISGSVISNVTLHNQDYIDGLELSTGDTVSVSRRGDVIPAIDAVFEKSPTALPVWRIPEVCPVCGTGLTRIGAHHFCPNFDCPSRQLGRLTFFVARDQMNINGLGAETVAVLWKHGLIADIPDIYALPYERIIELPGFGRKKIDLLRAGIEESKSRPYRTVLASLGIPDLGPNIAALLIENGYPSIDRLLDTAAGDDASELLSIKGIGEKTVERIVRTLQDERFRTLIAALKSAGLSFEEDVSKTESSGGVFSGQTWCVTGGFESFKPRERAMDEVLKRGGKVSSDVTGQTTHLLAGEKAGSKLQKALARGVKVVAEKDFLDLLS